MNFKRLLLFLAAPLALVMSSCEPDGPVYTNPSISITDADGAEVTAVNFSAEGGDATITITATRGWSISKQATWLGVTPSTYTNDTMEEKSVDVKITVGPNDDGPRTETIKVVMDKVEKNVVVSQAGEGQTALGEDLYYDNFDKTSAVENNGWPALDEYVNPVGVAAEGVTYTIANVQARSNSPSNNSYSGYKDTASGVNNAFFRTNGALVINNLNLAGQEGKDYTITFGCYRSVYEATDNSFKASEFHVYVSGDGEKWTELEYTRPADEVSKYGTWNLATATFSLKEKPATLSVCFKSDLVSSHRLDDVKLIAGGGGVEIDLSQGIELEIESGSGSGSTGGDNTPIEKDPNAQTITVAEFIEKAETETTYQLTGTISGSINTQYGNFDLVDESGSIYIYGLKEESGANVDWTAKGLNAGDVITVQGKYTLYTGKDGNTKHEIVNALYISHVDGEEPEVPEVELPEGTIVWEFGKDKQEWADDTHATYGAGTAATVDNVKFGFYKNTNTNDWNTTLQNDHVRVFKGAALAVKATDGKLIKSVVFECAYADKCANLSVSDGSTAVADTEALTISWTTEEAVAEFAAVSAAGQVRLKKMYLVLEGEGGGNTEPEDPEDPEDPETPVEPTVVTIASILALGQDATVAEGTFVEGVVISNSELDNLTSKKGLYIQDETAGLQFYCGANHSFKFGDKVKVDLSGQKIGAFNGAVQIGGTALDKFEVISSDNAVEAKTVTMADFLANKYEGQYIALEGVQVVADDLAKTWGDETKKNHISINMEDAEGNNFVVFSSKYATYAAETVAQGSGTIKGISSINVKDGVTTMQIIFAQATDYAGLTGERFGATVEPEQPEQPEEPETPVDPEEPAIVKVTVAEFKAAAEDETVYELTGVIKGTYNTYYGNFYLEDESGDVLIYGILNDGEMCYESLGLVDGDIITVQGTRVSHNDAAQMKNAEYVSHIVNTTPRILRLDVTSLLYTADAAEKTIKVTTAGEGGTLEATTAAEWLTVSVADGVVTVAAAANEGEAREAEVTVTFGDSSETVAVSQAAPVADGAEVADVIDSSFTGVTGTTYVEWSGKTGISGAVYAGQCAGDAGTVQMRSNKSNSGIVTTTSGGKVTKIVITWNTTKTTNTNRTVDIYGSHTAFSQATDMYNSTKADATKIASAKLANATNGISEVVLDGTYEFVGFRSNDGALYLDSVEITWVK